MDALPPEVSDSSNLHVESILISKRKTAFFSSNNTNYNSFSFVKPQKGKIITSNVGKDYHNNSNHASELSNNINNLPPTAIKADNIILESAEMENISDSSRNERRDGCEDWHGDVSNKDHQNDDDSHQHRHFHLYNHPASPHHHLRNQREKQSLIQNSCTQTTHTFPDTVSDLNRPPYYAQQYSNQFNSSTHNLHHRQQQQQQQQQQNHHNHHQHQHQFQQHHNFKNQQQQKTQNFGRHIISQPSRKTNFSMFTRTITVFLVVLLGLLATPTMASYDICSDVENDMLLPCQPSQLDAANFASLDLTLDPPDATCGTPSTVYQRLGDRTDTEYTCNAASTTGDAHPLSNILDSDRTSWWQSVSQTPGSEDLNINITLSFKKLFRFAGDLIVTFNSGRPEKMVLEKSVDNGVTWTPLQFYARNCEEFGDQVDVNAEVTKENPAVVICTNRNVELKSQPRPGGRVTLDLDERFELFLGPTLTDYAAYYQAIDTLMLDFLIFSDLRFRFIRPASDGRGSFNEYYYAIQDLNIMARCFCNLHASSCTNGDDKLLCVCQHNTQGVNCEECLPLYNERPWKRGNYEPYNDGVANECTKCECNDHAESCTFDATYGRGVCNACTHNTQGKHCEVCLQGFFPNMTMAVSDPDRCQACDCNDLGVDGDNVVCSQTAVPPAPIGQCVCKEQVTGRQCDSCIPGFYGLLEEPELGNCTACDCNLDGTDGQSNRCAQSGGQCPCKTSTTGRQCDTCKDGFYGFPEGSPSEECQPCACNEGGSTSLTCDKSTGKCTCKSGIDGDKCDRAAVGSYVPPIDSLGEDPASGSSNCDVTSDSFTDGAPFDGTTFAECDLATAQGTVTFNFAGGMIQAALQWPYYATIRYTNKNSQAVTGKITVTLQGDTTQALSPLSERLGQGISPGCPSGAPIEREITLPSGSSTAVVLTDNPVVLDGRCKFEVTLTLNSFGLSDKKRRKRQTKPAQLVQVDSVSLLPALSTVDDSTALTLYSSAADKAAAVQSYQDCLQDVAVLTTRNGAMGQAPCNQLLFAVVADIYGGASGCACDTTGSLFPTQCASLGGQCTCKTGVGGRACDRCHEGYFNFTEDGCQGCQCYAAGSEHGACDVTTGQCPCLSNVMTLTQEVSEQARTCSQCQPNFYGIDSGNGCSACSCNADGSTDLQCDVQGQCPCKDSIQGLKCDQCKPGFYGFGPAGCSACNCSEAGSTSINCDQATGTCTCKENVQGGKCEDCKAQMFNLASTNPKGCQPCFCYGHGQECQAATGFVVSSIEVSRPSPTDPLDVSVLYGQRQTSYGMLISLALVADFTLIVEGEQLLTFEGHGMTMYHLARAGSTIPRDGTLNYEVRFLEGEWKKDVDGTPTDITALELMGILADLSQITYMTRSKGQDLTMTFIKVEYPIESSDPSVVDDPATLQPMPVEQCTCNPAANVAGLSCEECATGFRRPEGVDNSTSSAASFDTCVACDCNGRGASDPPECDAMTGVCLNCRNGTTGDQCESCADNVIGDDCDTCQSEFWGLREDGCRACACSSPGSTSTVCDVETGQCACAPNVVGRTCDKCEENFHGLTADGCIECDNCYSLLKEGVGELRTIRDALVQDVSVVEERHLSNPSTKPFLVRFQEAIDTTNQLIDFLESAEQSENQVMTQIEALDQSLSSIESQLTTIDNATLPEVDANLAHAESAITMAKQFRASLETSSQNAKVKLDSLSISSQTLSDLANDLKDVKDVLQGIADASTADREILAQLDSLDTTVQTANTLANDILTKAQAALEIQKSTTGELLTLESKIISLEAKATKTSASASGLDVQSQETSGATAKLVSNLGELTAFTVDFDGLNSRKDVASTGTDEQANEMTTAQTSYTDLKTKSEATVDVVNDLTTQSKVIGNKAADWISRSGKAEEQANVISQRSGFIFQETEATLALLQDFDNRAQSVEDQANAKLEQVSSVQTVSQKLIEDSQTLTESLSSLQQTAANAKEASTQSKTVIQTKLTRIEGVEREATELKMILDSMDSGGEERIENIDATKTDIVQPGETLCNDIDSHLTTFNAELVNTDTITTNTLEQVGNATEKATVILSELRGLENVDASAAQALLAQITTAQSSLNVEELTGTINALIQSKEARRNEIDILKAKKESIKGQIASLNTLLQQIRPENA